MICGTISGARGLVRRGAEEALTPRNLGGQKWEKREKKETIYYYSPPEIKILTRAQYVVLCGVRLCAQ